MRPITLRGTLLWAGLVGLIAGCGDSEGPLDANAGRASARAPARAPADPPGLDGEFVRIARTVPGFGGLAFGPDGEAVVFLTDLKHEAAARAAVAPLLRARRYVVRGGPNRRAASGEVVVRQGQFDFRDLTGWRWQLSGSVFKIAGVIFVDTDERVNRIVLGADDRADAATIMAAARELGVPTAAVQLKRIPRLELTSHHLQDRFRPVPGGVRIETSNGTPCTAGFNANIPYPQNGYWYRFFVTNAHCTGLIGNSSSNAFWQPNTTIGNYAGYEFADPPLFQGGSCPPDYQCRWSDAALIQYDVNTADEFGYLARPYFGTTTIDPAQPRFPITQRINFPVGNEVIEKVGQTTGWTSGTVRHTCIDTEYPEMYFPTVLLLCQDYADYTSSWGDSGAPVFVQQLFSGGDVSLMGLHWGFGSVLTEPGVTYAIFSALSNIENDFGSLLVVRR